MAMVALFSACSAKKNTWLNRNYHNMTAYYNIYWNGNETYKELLAEIETLGYDNYSHVLNVYEYGSILDTAKTMEKTRRMIEKGTKAIEKHQILIRGVQYVKTIQDASMQIAKGYFYQHNYSMARTVLNFVTSQYPKEAIRFEAMLWLARTYIQEEEYEMASSLILQVQNNEMALSKQTYRELPAVTASFYIAQEQYGESIPFLREAIKRCKTKDFRNRLEFIIGQIYQLQENCEEAYKSYRYVTGHNAKLDLDYNARLNMALCYDSDYANREDLIKELIKMLQDTKNERFFGRIYFVLAEIELHDNRLSEGIGYLEKSVEYSGSDRDQLALSATRLADLYFDENDYNTAQKYYQNAVSVMTEDHPDYDRVSTRAENLTELVKYLDAVLYEEQMQYLAGLPEKKRNEEIDSIIESYKTKLETDAEKAPKVLSTPSSAQSPQNLWYFYNEQAKSFGANEFMRKWGRRDNEDFWFLQQKPVLMTNRSEDDSETEVVEEEVQKEVGDYTPADREYYLVNMPIKTAAKQKSDERLEENKFMLGAGYFDLVDEPKMGIATLEDLLKKYPNSGYKLQAYYYLYRMNLVLNNEAGKQKYKNLLISEFPDSDQTKQITDPNYYKTSQENTAKAELLYQYTFEAYSTGYYDAVLSNVQDAEKRYPGNALMPRFKYLETMAKGAQNGVDATILNLEQYIKTYPQEKDMVELARETIEYLKTQGTADSTTVSGETSPLASAQTKVEEEEKEPEVDLSMYKEDFAALHYCLIFLNVPEVNTDVVKIRLTDFNRRSFSQDNLRIGSDTWSEDYYLVYAYTFKTASIATGYFDELKKSTYVFSQIPKEFYQIMLISAENFSTFMKLRDKDTYQKFFEKYYNP